MRSGIVLALTLAVGAGVGLAVGLGIGKGTPPVPADDQGASPERDVESTASETPPTPAKEAATPPLRHDEARLRARIAELERQLATPRTAPPPRTDDMTANGPPPFRTDLLPDGVEARIVDPARLRETDRGTYQLGERILELRTGTEVRLQWAGLPNDQPLDPQLHEVSDRILIGRYTLDASRQGYVEVALANGQVRSFETEGEAYRYARREIGDVAAFHIETRDLDCAVIDLRPFATLPHVASLEAEMHDAAAEARRLDPRVVAPIVNVRR